MGKSFVFITIVARPPSLETLLRATSALLPTLGMGAQKTCRESPDMARTSVSKLGGRATIVMKTKDLPKGASCVFEGARATTGFLRGP